MNTPEKNNYIQYVNKNGIVKAKNVVFDKGEETTTFTVSGIDEEFFIFAIYENNIQRFCVGIENLENTDMLGFINSNMVDLSCIPEYAFLQPQTSVEFSYNNEYVENFRHGVQSGSGASDSSTDPDDLKYLKALMKSLYPTHTFTYVPWSVTYDNQMPNREEQPNLYSYGNHTCFFATLYFNGNLYLENKLSSHRNLAGDYVTMQLFQYGAPTLFTSFLTGEGQPIVYSKGYKVISNLPLWVE